MAQSLGEYDRTTIDGLIGVASGWRQDAPCSWQ